MRILLSILVSIGIGAGMYVVLVKKMSGPGGSPKATIALTTVQMQLVNIGEAERIYFVQNGSYASLDDLESSGTFSLKKQDPNDYIYSIETMPDGFKATAHHAEVNGVVPASFPVLSIDQSMKVEHTNPTATEASSPAATDVSLPMATVAPSPVAP